MQIDPTPRNGLDAEGYIQSSCALENVSPAFQPLLDASIALLTSTFQARLHSIYLYGSVATGHAQPALSDLDLLVIFNGPIAQPEQARIKSVEESLSASCRSLVREVGIGTVSIQEAFAKESLPGLGCFLKHLCVCASGEDIRPRLPKFRPSIQVARAFNGDYAPQITAMLNELEHAQTAPAAPSVMRRICRKTVRTAFSLVMPRLGCWTTDLTLSSSYFCHCYPEKQPAMALVCEWTRQPPRDKAAFLATVAPVAEWLAIEFERVIGSSVSTATLPSRTINPK